MYHIQTIFARKGSLKFFYAYVCMDHKRLDLEEPRGGDKIM